MSRQPNGDPSYLTRTSAVVTGYPFTVNTWFLPNTFARRHRLFTVNQAPAGTQVFAMDFHTNDFLRGYVDDGGGFQAATTANSANINAWNMGTIVFLSATDRTVILNADFANKGTNVVSRTPTGLDTTSIGFGTVATGGSTIDYLQSNVAVYGTGLSDNEITSLFRGAFPHEIRRGSLLNHWRLLGNTSPEPDAIGNADMTLVSAPAKGNHSDRKLWTPPPPTLFIPVPGPSGGAIQKSAFEYRH